MKKIILYISLVGNILLIALLVRSALFYNENMKNSAYKSEFISKNNQEYQLGNNPPMVTSLGNTAKDDKLEEVQVVEEKTSANISNVKEIEIGEEKAIEPATKPASSSTTESSAQVKVEEKAVATAQAITEDQKIAQSAKESVTKAIEEKQSQPVVDTSKKLITKVETTYRNSLLSLQIDANQGIDARAYVLNNPERLVIDVKGTWELPEIPVIAQNGFARALRTGYQRGVTRFVVDMRKANFTYDLQKRGKSLQVFIFFNTAH